MKPRISTAYLEKLLTSGSYEALIEVLALLEGSGLYNRQLVDYGLGTALFVFAESLLWFAHGTRSGAITYFEVASLERQELMERELSELAPPDFAAAYVAGKNMWRDSLPFDSLDLWMERNDERNNHWLSSLIRQHRGAFELTVLAP